MIQIDSAAVKGEPGTGFEKRGDKGPFECGNCKYFADGQCRQKVMRKVSKQPKAENGNVLVAIQDCCEYVERIGHIAAARDRFVEAHKARGKK